MKRNPQELMVKLGFAQYVEEKKSFGYHAVSGLKKRCTQR
jgi:hypothetical protein